MKHIFKNKLTSTLFVTTENKGFDQIPSVNPETNQQIYTFDNFYNFFSYGIKEGFTYNPTSWWKTNSQATFSYFDGSFNKGFDDLGKFQSGFNFDLFSNHNFFLNADKTLQLEATFTYGSPKKVMMYELGAQSSLDIAVKALFLDKKLQATFAFNDIYKGMEAHITTYTNNVKQEYGNYFDSRNFNTTLTYKFGNEDLKSKHREAKNQDIQERTD